MDKDPDIWDLLELLRTMEEQQPRFRRCNYTLVLYTDGSGCVHSAAIDGRLCEFDDLAEAQQVMKTYLAEQENTDA